MKNGRVYKVVEDKIFLPEKPFMSSLNLKKSKRRFCSCVVYDMDCAVSYDIGRTTKPKIGKLFAFNLLEKARDFRDGGLHRVILECKAKNIEYASKICGVFDIEDFVMFWSNDSHFGCSSPYGTVVCDSITPIGIVQ